MSIITVDLLYAALAVAVFYIWRLRSRVAAARFDAVHDPLTGAFNRRILHQAIDDHVRSGQAFTIAIGDVDRFKDINDRYGHQAGDSVLVEITRRLTLAGDGISHLIRLGGDEFALIVAGDDDHAVTIAKAMWQLIAAKPFTLPGHPVRQIDVSVSVGVASHTLGVDPSSLLRQADTALSDAKPSVR